jgi:hypothetical protein
MADDASRKPSDEQTGIHISINQASGNAGRDQASGDITGRDQVGGDRISAGSIDGAGVSMGRGAISSAAVSTADYMAELASDILRRLLELERKVMELEIRYLERARRDQHDRSTVSGTTTAIIGGMIFLAIVTMMLYLALSGLNASAH